MVRAESPGPGHLVLHLRGTLLPLLSVWCERLFILSSTSSSNSVGLMLPMTVCFGGGGIYLQSPQFCGRKELFFGRCRELERTRSPHVEDVTWIRW